MSMALYYARCKQVDVIIGLDLSKNTNDRNFNQQRQFFQEMTEELYSFNGTATSIRVGVFAYDDTIRIHPKTELWSKGNMTEQEVEDAIKTVNYSNNNDYPYFDHALRFVLATLDDDRSKNKERECSEKILILVVTELIEKWSDGQRDLARLKKMGVKVLLVVVRKAAESDVIELEDKLVFSSFDELVSTDIKTNASEFIRNIVEDGKGSCCDSSFSVSQLKDKTCSTQMGNMCEIMCSGILDTKVVSATCELNGVWSLGKEDACKDFGLHVVSFIFGAGSLLIFLAIVAVIVFLLYRKKCQSKSETITPAIKSSIHRSVRNKYSASTSQKLAAEQPEVESDEDSDESDAVVYDYAEENVLHTISKRRVKSQEDIQKHTNKKRMDIVHFNAELGLGVDFNNETKMLNKEIKPNSQLAAMEGTWYSDDGEIYMNEQNGYEDNQEIYMNT